MKIAFVAFLITLINLALILTIAFVYQKNMEIVEIQSPPYFYFTNPYSNLFSKLKKQLILQKILSETKIYGKSPFLVESIQKLNEVKYFLKVFNVNYFEKTVSKKYWWGTSEIEILQFKDIIFYYMPVVEVGKTGERFGKILFHSLKGKRMFLDSKDLNPISIELLKRYGVKIHEK
ncbi:hypothetical protein HNP65_000897 [Thermosipho japonicus]|uniref:Uncharacterized protein n=1 Tax=Thermosipho japonicus TaxID=90323 RepID=A0A841GRX7_9BACT|nr:hypothetical protein [Thermosipho japonicus]MBB6062459.1 hypothetical protein [Thermosipho japonicus]